MELAVFVQALLQYTGFQLIICPQIIFFMKHLLLYLAAVFFLVIIVIVAMRVFVNMSDRGAKSDNRPLVLKTPLEKTSVHLYFGARDNSFLIAEKRDVPCSDNIFLFGETIINELIQGPVGGRLMRTLPPDVFLRAFYVTGDHTAFADLSGELGENHPGGVKAELFTIYSIVNSLILNIPEIKSVKILIKGVETLTIAGHVSLEAPFKADMLLIR